MRSMELRYGLCIRNRPYVAGMARCKRRARRNSTANAGVGKPSAGAMAIMSTRTIPARRPPTTRPIDGFFFHHSGATRYAIQSRSSPHIERGWMRA